MAMVAADRAATSTALQRHWSQDAEAIGITKADLLAAVNAADDWCDANATSFNSALPQPARSTLTTAQKTFLLVYVLRRRNGDLRISEDG